MTHITKSYSAYAVDFIFSVNGKTYKGDISNSYNFRTSASFQGRSFPVAYQENNISNAFILIKPEDFKKFKQEFPDSLNWVKDELLK